VISLTALWGILTFDKLAPTSEGWYVTYANMILAGKVPYQDFEMVFFPLYAYFSALVVNVFGESLIVFRIIGVILVTATSAVAYYLFRLLFKPWIAATAALITIFLAQIEVSNINYDYHQFFNLFVFIMLFLILKTFIKLAKEERINTDLYLFFAGLCCAFALLIRHPSGILLFCFISVFLILTFLFMKGIRLTIRNLGAFLIGFLVPVLILFTILAVNGLFSSFIEMVFFSGSKGDIFVASTAWIERWLRYMADDNRQVIISFVLAAFLAFRLLRPRTAEREDNNIINYSVYIITLVISAIMVIILFRGFDAPSIYALNLYYDTFDAVNVVFTMNIIVSIVLIFLIFLKVRQKRKIETEEFVYLFLCGTVFVITFGGAMSNTLTFVYGGLNVGLIVAMLIKELSKTRFRLNLSHVAVCFVFLMVVSAVVIKLTVPYNWWSATERYTEAVYPTDIDYFDGMKLTYAEKEMYEDFVIKIQIYMNEEDELYCYSNNIIFYSLAGKMPNVRAAVPWMDVSSEGAIISDLEYLKANLPKMILFIDHGAHYLNVHEELFNGGKESVHRQLHGWLTEQLDRSHGYGDGTGDFTFISFYSAHGFPMYLLLRNG
jgi:4-amino-4-deoxy-L-arabinose transferase-like glycosyltransferase